MTPPKKEEQPLPPLATGIALGLWISVMLVLAFVIVPFLFSSCMPPPVDAPQ